MNAEILELTRKLDRRPPASLEDLQMVQDALGIKFPQEYAEWMLSSNGGSGPIGENSYLLLWPLERIVSLNEAYQVSKFAPGLVLFGSDGGGEGYAFDTRQPTLPIVQVPFVGMSLDAVRACGATFLDFLRYLSQR